MYVDLYGKSVNVRKQDKSTYTWILQVWDIIIITLRSLFWLHSSLTKPHTHSPHRAGPLWARLPRKGLLDWPEIGNVGTGIWWNMYEYDWIWYSLYQSTLGIHRFNFSRETGFNHSSQAFWHTITLLHLLGSLQSWTLLNIMRVKSVNLTWNHGAV